MTSIDNRVVNISVSRHWIFVSNKSFGYQVWYLDG